MGELRGWLRLWRFGVAATVGLVAFVGWRAQQGREERRAREREAIQAEGHPYEEEVRAWCRSAGEQRCAAARVVESYVRLHYCGQARENLARVEAADGELVELRRAVAECE